LYFIPQALRPSAAFRPPSPHAAAHRRSRMISAAKLHQALAGRRCLLLCSALLVFGGSPTALVGASRNKAKKSNSSSSVVLSPSGVRRKGCQSKTFHKNSTLQAHPGSGQDGFHQPWDPWEKIRQLDHALPVPFGTAAAAGAFGWSQESSFFHLSLGPGLGSGMSGDGFHGHPNQEDERDFCDGEVESSEGSKGCHVWCRCEWYQDCYNHVEPLSDRVAALYQHKKHTGPPPLMNVGMCSWSVAMLIVASLGIFAVTFLVVFALRSILLDWAAKEEWRNTIQRLENEGCVSDSSDAATAAVQATLTPPKET